jgi:hypothetical protein
MFKRFFAVFFLVCMVPVVVHAWTLSTWVRTAGGTIVVDGGAPQTLANGNVYKNYTTSRPLTVQINPNTGYSISQVNYNNVITSNPSQTSYLVQGPTAQNVQAYFSPQILSITASAETGGTVTPTSLGNISYGTKLTTAKKFIFTPDLSVANVANITGIPSGATLSSTLPAPAGTSVTVTLPIGFTFISNMALNGSFFAPPIAKTITSQRVLVGKPVTLDGSASTGSPTSYAWTQTSGPGFPTTKVIAENTPGAVVTFTPTALGDYTFTLTVSGGSTASTTVTVIDGTPIVYDNITGLARTQCYNCHFANGVGVASNVFNNWSSSGHKTKGIICSQCHYTVLAGDHPGPLKKGSVSETTFNYTASAGSGNFCISCHNPVILTDFALSKHSIRAGAASCSFCHAQGVHNPSVACIDCHKPDNVYGLLWPPAGLAFHSSFADGKICKVCHNSHNPKTLSISTSCP